jgi:hypothetical protein
MRGGQKEQALSMSDTMRIDPRDFIMGPYLRCPRCGVEEFGVLNVGDTRCTRRCRACWHTAAVHLPELKKKIVYIDQFAFSNIMKLLSPEVKGHERTASEPFWNELFETLGVVCHLQLVVCPDSKEHQHESLTSSFYKALKRTYEHFSGGLSFYDAETIKRLQVARLTECWLKKEDLNFDFASHKVTHGNPHEWGGRVYVTVDGVLPGMVDELRTMRNSGHKGLQEVFAQWQKEKKSFKEVLEVEKAAYCQSLVSMYRAECEMRAQMLALAMRGQMPSLNDILYSQTSYMVMQLQKTFEHAVGTEQSVAKMSEFLRSGAINEAPFNIIAASMYASLAQKAAAGQKKVPNQGTFTDVNVVSTLLPYCDAMFIDNGCKALLLDIPREHKLPFPCEVFSPNTGADFIHYLQEIRGSASSEHLKLIEEVYGPDPLKPQKSIYGVGKRKPSTDT